jgi:hypothetical protein
VMLLDPPADGEPPGAPAQPAHTATNSVAIRIFIIRVSCTAFTRCETSF